MGRGKRKEEEYKMGLRDRLTALQDPQIVWRFQKYFGVEKVKEVKNSDSGPWVALDAQHMTTSTRNYFGGFLKLVTKI